ncbi:hypothetical protein J7E91_31655 [Streptomyces sp. ISL-99]|uniref:hypothetical protein n=1 Tax=Streptomyces sp. ISL-99 TaxID=2819193 RepID=UPI001BE6E941|nr:hypothetical protein [Streptomyces sp. ISL-99]MBT2529809.1 hypothetical protein [Streptomyces sp. ISL-99]
MIKRRSCGEVITAGGAVVAALIVVGGPMLWRAAAADERPKLSVTGPEKTAEVEVDRTAEGRALGHLRLVVTSTGTAESALASHAYLDRVGNRADNDCTQDSAAEVQIVGKHKKVAVPNAVPVDIKLVVLDKCVGREGTLVLTGAPESDPTTVRFNLTRAVEGNVAYRDAVCWAFVAALLACSLMAMQGQLLKVRQKWQPEKWLGALPEKW